MKFRIYTNGIPLAAVLNIESDHSIMVKGYHPDMPNTEYFNQRITPEYLHALNNKVKFNMPIVPEKFLVVDITDEDRTTSTATLKGISAVPLRTKPVYLTPKDKDFMACMDWFATMCGTLGLGNYERNGIRFEYVEEIIDPSRGPMMTPAQVDHETSVISFARKYFINYSIPMREFIGWHERVHFVLDTQKESEADLNALNVCLSRGFPKMEMLYAATKVFPDTMEARNRVAHMVDFIESFH